jgi:divalent metal cation (Fe/Co/Zn/Cd) transporter
MDAQHFLVELALGGGGGVMTYLVAKYLFDESNRYTWIQALSSNGKRNLVYVLAMLGAGVPYALAVWLGYFTVTADTLLAMFGTAFMVSQKLHGSLELTTSAMLTKMNLTQPK